MSVLQTTVIKAMPHLTAAQAAMLAQEIGNDAAQAAQDQRLREKWDRLGPIECAARMRTAHSLNVEALLAQALESPPDETSPSSPAATTDSPTPT